MGRQPGEQHAASSHHAREFSKLILWPRPSSCGLVEIDSWLTLPHETV